ncbi:MAG TPA: sortase [Actinomycetota bacterium]|nr:sortase [Actinomycetota bacterium]
MSVAVCICLAAAGSFALRSEASGESKARAAASSVSEVGAAAESAFGAALPTGSVAAPAPKAIRPAVAGIKSAAGSFPGRGSVSISSIGVSGPVVTTSLDANRDMVIPDNSRDVAWLDYNGTFPGPTKNAVLAGHRRWKGKGGTLEPLEKAKPGDEVVVVADGTEYRFAFTWIRMYDANTPHAEELLGPTSVKSLTLVTCGGRFDPRTGHYQERVVARAELVKTAPAPAPQPAPRGDPQPKPDPAPQPLPSGNPVPTGLPEPPKI